MLVLLGHVVQLVAVHNIRESSTSDFFPSSLEMKHPNEEFAVLGMTKTKIIVILVLTLKFVQRTFTRAMPLRNHLIEKKFFFNVFLS